MFFVSCVSHTFTSVHCCLVVTCWEGPTSWFFLVMFIVFFVPFPCGILGQVWYLIVSYPDLCCLAYFHSAGYSLHISVRFLEIIFQ